MRRLVPALAALLTVAALVPASAAADGDPASDVLLTDTIYVPYARPSEGVQVKLRKVVDAARDAGQPMRLAIVQSRQDLGAVPDYFGRPGEYARFLAGELAAYTKLIHPDTGAKATRDPLLVVMPAGFGTSGFSSAADAKVRAIDLSGDSSSDGLTSAAGYAVQELAKQAGHPIATVFSKPAGGGGGGGVLVPLLVGLGLLLLAAVAIFARVRAAPQTPAGNT